MIDNMYIKCAIGCLLQLFFVISAENIIYPYEFAPNMGANRVLIETRDNRHIDGVVADELAYCHGGGEVVGEPTLEERDVAAGAPYKKTYLRIDRGAIKDSADYDNLYEKLIKNTHSYERSGFIKRSAIMGFRYWHWYYKIDKSLHELVDNVFLSEVPETPINIGMIRVMDTEYSVTLEMQSVGAVSQESICVGSGRASQGYYPMGKGCGGESESFDPVAIYSMIEGTEYKFKLTFER